jgi:glutamate transport system permease protein
VVALKDTSLGFYVLAPGLTRVGKGIYTQFANQVQTALVIAALYILVNLALSWVATWVQRRFVGERRLSVGTGDETADVTGGTV